MLKIPLHTVKTQHDRQNQSLCDITEDELMQVVTKDLVKPQLNAVCYYQIENAVLCSSALSALTPALQTVVQAAVRDVLAQHTFSHVLLHRRRIGQEIQAAADAAACRWGIKVERADM